MNELLLNDEKLTTADVAFADRAREVPPAEIPTEINDLNFQSGQAVQVSVVGSQPGPIFPDDELHSFRARWDEVQTSFVDEPRQAVEQADNLVANVVKRIAEQFSAERTQLEKQWDSGDSVSTEDLRQALKRYRSLFDRLLSF
jgi:hypothetical protein